MQVNKGAESDVVNTTLISWVSFVLSCRFVDFPCFLRNKTLVQIANT